MFTRLCGAICSIMVPRHAGLLHTQTQCIETFGDRGQLLSGAPRFLRLTGAIQFGNQLFLLPNALLSFRNPHLDPVRVIHQTRLRIQSY